MYASKVCRASDVPHPQASAVVSETVTEALQASSNPDDDQDVDELQLHPRSACTGTALAVENVRVVLSQKSCWLSTHTVSMEFVYIYMLYNKLEDLFQHNQGFNSISTKIELNSIHDHTVSISFCKSHQ